MKFITHNEVREMAELFLTLDVTLPSQAHVQRELKQCSTNVFAILGPACIRSNETPLETQVVLMRDQADDSLVLVGPKRIHVAHLKHDMYTKENKLPTRGCIPMFVMLRGTPSDPAEALKRHVLQAYAETDAGDVFSTRYHYWQEPYYPADTFCLVVYVPCPTLARKGQIKQWRLVLCLDGMLPWVGEWKAFEPMRPHDRYAVDAAFTEMGKLVLDLNVVSLDSPPVRNTYFVGIPHDKTSWQYKEWPHCVGESNFVVGQTYLISIRNQDGASVFLGVVDSAERALDVTKSKDFITGASFNALFCVLTTELNEEQEKCWLDLVDDGCKAVFYILFPSRKSYIPVVSDALQEVKLRSTFPKYRVGGASQGDDHSSISSAAPQNGKLKPKAKAKREAKGKPTAAPKPRARKSAKRERDAEDPHTVASQTKPRNLHKPLQPLSSDEEEEEESDEDEEDEEEERPKPTGTRARTMNFFGSL